MTPRAESIALSHYSQNRNESWNDIISRVVSHQKWLWERIINRKLRAHEHSELIELENLLRSRKICCSGRHLLHSSTQNGKKYEISTVSSTYLSIRTPYDLCDFFWLTLNGCGIGLQILGEAVQPYKTAIEQIFFENEESNATLEKYEPESRLWTLNIGATPKEWVHALKIILFKTNEATKVKLTSNHDYLLEIFKKIITLLSQHVTKSTLLQIIHFLGKAAQKRKASQALFLNEQKDEFETDLSSHLCQYAQLINKRPTSSYLQSLFEKGTVSFINQTLAKKKFREFEGLDSCATTLLPDKGVSLLSEINLCAFKTTLNDLERATELTARMNYRQTFIELNDGVLQSNWQLNHQKHRLCGLGLTGLFSSIHLTKTNLARIRHVAKSAARQHAEELGARPPALLTCVKQSGTLSKVFGSHDWGEVPEGMHSPIGPFVFNQISFPSKDPIANHLISLGYHYTEHPFESNHLLIKFPVHYKSLDIHHREPALDQLNRYRILMDNWCDHNVSNTITYSTIEIPQIIHWIIENWDSIAGLSFQNRENKHDFPYQPQRSVHKKEFFHYCHQLKKQELLCGK